MMKRKEKAPSDPPADSVEDPADLEAFEDEQAEDVELLREIVNTQFTIKDQLRESLIDTGFELDIGGVHIYDWKESGWAIPLVLIYNAVFLASFFYFCYTLTLTNERAQYLSLDGTTNAQECKAVPLQVTGTFEGDVFGNWETELSFQQNSSIFMLNMVGTSVTVEKYKKVMGGFKEKLAALSEKSSRRDAAWNAMAWAVYTFDDPATSMTFYSSADVSSIYNNDISMAALSSAKSGMCSNLYQYGTFDDATTSMSIHVMMGPENVPVQVLQGYQPPSAVKEACPGQFLAHQWLDNTHVVVPEWDTPGEMVLSFDMNSAVNAIALNMGINTLSTYTKVTSAYGDAGAGGVPGTWIISAGSVPMDPIFCLDVGAYRKKYKIDEITDSQVAGPPVCFLVQGPMDEPIFYYPITASYYTLPLTGEFAHCKCPEDGTNPQCNGRDLVVAFLYDMNHTLPEITNSFKIPLRLQKLLVDDPVNGDLDMQDYVTPVLASAYYVTPPFGQAAMNKSIRSFTKDGVYYDYNFLHGTYANTHRVEWMNICPWGTCGAVIFESYRSTLTDGFLPLNVYQYQAVQDPALFATYTAEFGASTQELKQSMCMNNLYIDAALDGLTDAFPTALVQPYNQCHSTTMTALQVSVGSAAGVANIVAGVFMLAFGFMFLRVYNGWATRTVKKKLEDPNYMPGRDVKLVMPVTQKAKIEAKLEEKRTSSLLDAMAGFAVKIRRLEDELASIPRKKKKKGYDEIPPEEVDMAERLHRMQKYFTLDLNGAMAKSKAGLTKEALMMVRYKREMAAVKAEKEGSANGSTVKTAVGSAAKSAGEKAKSEKAKGEKKAALEIESAGADANKKASSFFSGVFGGAPVGDKGAGEGGDGDENGEDRV